MARRLRTNPRAEADILEAVDFVAQDAPERARRWYAGLKRELRRLPESPFSFSICPESEDLGVELRQFHFHSHRVIFRILGDTVEVLRVYHGARRPLDLRELPE